MANTRMRETVTRCLALASSVSAFLAVAAGGPGSPGGVGRHDISASLGVPAVQQSSAVWSWPLSSRQVLRTFDPPPERWGSGHRGIDIDASPGDIVLAPANGTVWFVGTVVDRRVLTVQDDAGRLASFEPVASTLELGERVVLGMPIATVLPGHQPCGSCLHLGARVDGEYVHPLSLLGSEPPILYPLDGRPAG